MSIYTGQGVRNLDGLGQKRFRPKRDLCPTHVPGQGKFEKVKADAWAINYTDGQALVTRCAICGVMLTME